MNSENQIPQLLYRFWSELVRDCADWVLRTPTLLTQLAGMVCLRRALQKTLEIDDLLQSLKIDAAAVPPLPNEKAKVLEEMADARTPEVFFSSIPLFWVGVMQSAAEGWAKENLSLPAFEQFTETAIDQEESDHLIAILFPDEATRTECFRWAGHLVDILSEAGGFGWSSSSEAMILEDDYCWAGELPGVDEKYLVWMDDGFESQSQQQRTGTDAYLVTLTLYDSWRALEGMTDRRTVLRLLLSHLDEGIDALEALFSGVSLHSPLQLNRLEFIARAALPINARLQSFT